MSKTTGTQVISRTCSILRSFDEAHPELSLAEIARKNQLHPTTAYRILQALVEEGFLIQDSESTKYSLGYGLVQIGELAKQGNALLKMVRPHAEKLAQIWKETISIEILNGLEVDTVLFIPATYRIGALPPHGKPIPAHCTATGKAQLAFLPADQLESLLTSEFKAITANTITDPERLRADLAKVREQGYAIAMEELEVGFIAVAAPIFDRIGRAFAAISVGGPSSRFSKEQIAEIAASVVKIAREISEEMGHIENKSR